MADGVEITPGTGALISTDEVGVNGGTVMQVEHVKLVDGRSNGTDGLPGDTQGLWVVPRRDLQRIQAISSGLTILTTTYSAGDQVGPIFTLANAARASGGTGTLVGLSLMDESAIIGAYDVVLFRQSVTLAADNAAFAISDTDALQMVGIAQLAGSFNLTNNRVAQAFNLAIPYDCAGGTSLFAALITRVNHSFFSVGGVDSLALTAWVERN